MGMNGEQASGAELSTQQVAAPEGEVRGLEPPDDLNVDEIKVWATIAGDPHAGHLSRASMPLLAQYCRHIAAARLVAAMIEVEEANPSFEIAGYVRLLRMQTAESGAIASLATTLCLSQQATHNHRGNRRSTDDA
jgi:hypothetical protein